MLAARLAEDGLSVVAIDADPEAVENARRRGVNAFHASWPDFDGDRFEAVLFTRSLHHMTDLEACVDAAAGRLAPSGTLIVEDFDAAYSDAPTLRLFAGLARLIQATGSALDEPNLLAALASGTEPLARIWRGDHDHELHSAARIERVLEARFPRVTASAAAYFFRYVGDRPDLQPVAAALRDLELQLIERKQIAPLGRRFVARAGDLEEA